MKRFIQSVALMIFTMFATSFSCAQNGPTPPQAIGTWTQAVANSTSGPVTGNSVYRCTVPSGQTTCIPTPPAISTSATPIVTYTDNTIAAGSTYVYAVTAHFGAVEGPYSNASTPFSWAFTAPTFGTVIGAIVPQAQAEEMVAQATPDCVALSPTQYTCKTVPALGVTFNAQTWPFPCKMGETLQDNHGHTWDCVREGGSYPSTPDPKRWKLNDTKSCLDCPVVSSLVVKRF